MPQSSRQLDEDEHSPSHPRNKGNTRNWWAARGLRCQVSTSRMTAAGLSPTRSVMSSRDPQTSCCRLKSSCCRSMTSCCRLMTSSPHWVTSRWVDRPTSQTTPWTWPGRHRWVGRWSCSNSPFPEISSLKIAPTIQTSLHNRIWALQVFISVWRLLGRLRTILTVWSLSGIPISTSTSSLAPLICTVLQVPRDPGTVSSPTSPVVVTPVQILNLELFTWASSAATMAI